LSSDDEDEETLQQHFQLRSRFCQAGMLDVSFEEPAVNLKDDVLLPPRQPCYTTCKCAVKKLNAVVVE
jgi:hypothetical protein